MLDGFLVGHQEVQRAVQIIALAYRLELVHCFECLQVGRPFQATIDDGVEAQKLADTAARSLETGQVVRL